MSNVKKHKVGITLDPQSADPSSPVEGQMMQSDGTVRAAGLWQYVGGTWQQAGGGAGDSDTIHLIKAASDSDTDFTIKSIDDVLPDFDGSDTLTATFDVPTSGSNALLSEDDDHKVYRIATASTSIYDAVGRSFGVPRYARGRDVLLEFQYRTYQTTGSSTDSDYMVWIVDDTNMVNTTTTSTGSISAGTAITVGSTTGMAVGDKIWVGETGGTTQVTEAHVTEVTSGTQLKISEDVNLSSGDRFVTGVLSDVLTTINAADDDTNKSGTSFKKYVQIPSDCANLKVIWQQLTSETDSFLYFDNILLSSDPFKKVETQGQPEEFHAYDYAGKGSTNTYVMYYNTINKDTLNDCLSYDNDSTNGLVFTALKKCKIDATVWFDNAATADWIGFVKNGTLNTYLSNSTNDAARLSATRMHVASNTQNSSVSVILEAGDTLAALTETTTAGNTANYSNGISLVATPLKGTSIIVESADSVMSGWTAYTMDIIDSTGTSVKSSSPLTNTAFWRRDGSDMLITFSYYHTTTTGSAGTGSYFFTVPSGYVVDTSVITAGGGNSPPIHGSANGDIGGGTLKQFLATGVNSSGVSLYEKSTNTYVASGGSYAFNNTYVGLSGEFRVPIQGWSATNKPLLAFPTVTVGQDAEHAAFHTRGDADGLASTNTKIVYYATETVNSVSNLGTISNSATDGFSFTATSRCKVKATSYLAFTTASWHGWTKNSSQLTTAFSTVTDSQQYGASYSAANETTSAPFEGILEAGDVIRVHCDGATVGANAYNCGVTILVEPEIGQQNMAAIISQPVAYVRYNTASSELTLTSTHDVICNSIDGDIADVGLSLDSSTGVFTLPAGKFQLKWYAYFSHSNTTKVGTTVLYDSTNSAEIRRGTITYQNTASEIYQMSQGSDTVINTSERSFKMQADVVQGSGGTLRLGTALAAPDTEKLVLEITRKK